MSAAAELNLVCDRHVIFVRPDTTSIRGRIWISCPRKLAADVAECRVGIGGLLPELGPVRGEDTLQALVLTVRLVGALLSRFVSGGGRVIDEDGAEIDLNTYFGSLCRAPAAFGEADLVYSHFDVSVLLAQHGLASVALSDRARCARWLHRRGYGTIAIDCALGGRAVRRQLGERLDWKTQFGYELTDEGGRSLDALRDGFDFDIGDGGALALELVAPEALHREDARWLEGLLAVASEYSLQQLALGRRFITVLYLDGSSSLVGREVERVTVPHVWTPVFAAPAEWGA